MHIVITNSITNEVLQLFKNSMYKKEPIPQEHVHVLKLHETDDSDNTVLLNWPYILFAFYSFSVLRPYYIYLYITHNNNL